MQTLLVSTMGDREARVCRLVLGWGENITQCGSHHCIALCDHHSMYLNEYQRIQTSKHKQLCLHKWD